MRRYPAIVTLALITAVAPAARAEPEPSYASPEYQDAITHAVDAHRTGRWEEAHRLLMQAHAIAPSARTHRALGMTAFELGNYVDAFRALSAALVDDRRPLSSEQRAQVATLRDRVTSLIGLLRFEVSATAFQVEADGQHVELEPDGSIVLPVGTHQLVITAPGFSPYSTSLTIRGGERSTLKIELEPSASVGEKPVPPTAARAERDATAERRPRVDSNIPATPGVGQPSRPGRLWTWVAAGTSAAFGATAIAFGLAGQTEYDRLQEECRPGCVRGDATKDPDLSTLRLFERGTNIALAATAVAAGAAVTLFFIEGQSTETAHVAVAGEADRVLVSGRF